jgi:hypothetical protein
MEHPILNAFQEVPTFAQAQAMCQQVSLDRRTLVDRRLDTVLNQIRETHVNGGALFASFNVGPSKAFDWFASGSRLTFFGVLRQLLYRVEVRNALPALEIEPSKLDDPAFVVPRLGDLGKVDSSLADFGIRDDLEVGRPEYYDDNFGATSSFLFDGELAQKLYYGGAYPSASAKGNGRTEKENSLAFCEALFGLRFSEVDYYSTHNGWTPWFGNIGIDWTAILFDRRVRALSILAVTDTD